MINIKRWGFIALVLISFLIFINVIEEPSIISKFIFTMKAVSDSLSLSVTIDSGFAPNVTIYEPISRVYSTSLNMILGYQVMDDGVVSSVWFNINNGSNTTLDKNGYIYYFNATLGNNTLYMFANDTQGNLNDSVKVNFTIGKYDIYNYEINNSGGVYFTDPTVNEYIKSVTGLDPSWTLNTTVYGNNTPSNWVRPTNVNSEFLYFEMSVNAIGNTAGNYNLYFNLSRAALEDTDPTNVAVYFYNANSWNEMTTMIENSDTDPVEFRVILTHLSQFMIGEKGADSGTSAGGVTGQLGRGLRGERPEEPSAEVPEEAEIIKPPEEEKPKKVGEELIFPEFEPLGKLSWLSSIFSLLSLVVVVLVVVYLLRYGFIFKDHKRKNISYFLSHAFSKMFSMRTIVIFLLIGLVYYALRSFLGITGSIVGNMRSSENILFVVALLIIVLAIIYFFVRKD